MSYTDIKLPDELIQSLTKIYVKYIKQENKFNDIFVLLNDKILKVTEEINATSDYYCSNYRLKYINTLKELDLNIYLNDYDIITVTKELIKHLINLANTFTYGALTLPRNCLKLYNDVLIDELNKIKEKILNTPIQTMYQHIANDPIIKEITNILVADKDVVDDQIKEPTNILVANKDVVDDQIKEPTNILVANKDVANNSIIKEITNILVADKDVVDDPIIKEIKEPSDKYIDIQMANKDVVDDPIIKEIKEPTYEYVANMLKTKYEEFIAISPQVFTKEIKRKIKKSVLEIISIELNLQKKLNLKKSLPFTNAVKDFLSI